MTQPATQGATLSGSQPEQAAGLAPPRARGTEIGRYIVVGRVGAGAMGVVYAAYDPDLDRKVAVKLLHPRTSSTPGSAGRLRGQLVREAQAMAKLSHPNVVAVHDVGVSGADVFLAMEFIEGGTLDEWLAARRRPWREIVRAFRDAAHGLSAAHAAMLVHRDFKPQNVLIGHDGRVCVTDFGLARRVGPSAAPPAVFDAEGGVEDDTRALGQTAGTPAFMAPEQLLGLGADAQSDQFAFCVSLWRALYGGPPFRGGSIAALAYAITHGQLEEPRGADGVPGWLRGVLRRGLAADPTHRFPGMGALLAALADDPQARTRRRRWMTTLGAGIAIACGGWAVSRHQRLAHCDDVVRAHESAWSEARARGVRTAMLETGVGYAEDAWVRTSHNLDAYVGRWAEATSDACVADTEVPPAIAAATQACLLDRLASLTTLVDVLAVADADAVREAVRASAGLPSLVACSEPDAAIHEDTPRRRAARDATARARTLNDVARFGQAQLVAEAVVLGDDRQSLTRDDRDDDVLAAAMIQLGRAHERQGHPDLAEPHLRRAFELAGRAGADEVAAEAAARLAFVLAVGRGDSSAGEAWHDVGAMLLARRGLSRSEVASTLHTTSGWISMGRGELDSAEASLQRALDMRVDLLGPDSAQVAMAYNALGGLARARGEHDLAFDDFGRALAVAERVLGPEHPDAGLFLQNQAVAALDFGDAATAADLAARGLANRRRALGEAHPEVGDAATVLAAAEHALGEVDRAAATQRAANAIHAMHAHPSLPNGQLNLARIERAAGANLAARALARLVVDDPRAPAAVRAAAHHELAILEHAAGAQDAATQHVEAAIELARTVGADDDAAQLQIWAAEHRSP